MRVDGSSSKGVIWLLACTVLLLMQSNFPFICNAGGNLALSEEKVAQRVGEIPILLNGGGKLLTNAGMRMIDEGLRIFCPSEVEGEEQTTIEEYGNENWHLRLPTDRIKKWLKSDMKYYRKRMEEPYCVCFPNKAHCNNNNCVANPSMLFYYSEVMVRRRDDPQNVVYFYVKRHIPLPVVGEEDEDDGCEQAFENKIVLLEKAKVVVLKLYECTLAYIASTGNVTRDGVRLQSLISQYVRPVQESPVYGRRVYL